MKEKIIKFLEERIDLGKHLIESISNFESQSIVVAGIAALTLTKEYVETLKDEA